MMKRLLAFTALIACLAIPAEAQIVTGNAGGGGGGSGTVTSLTAAPGVTCSPNPVTGAGACGTTEALGNGGTPITGTTYAVNLSNSEPSDLAKELVFTGTSQLNATVGAGSAGMGFDIYNQSNTVAAIFTITGSVFYCHNGTCGSSGTLGLSSGQYANVFYDATISGWRATLFDEAGLTNGFPITLGTTSIAANSTTTSITGLSITAGSSNSIVTSGIIQAGTQLKAGNGIITSGGAGNIQIGPATSGASVTENLSFNSGAGTNIAGSNDVITGSQGSGNSAQGNVAIAVGTPTTSGSGYGTVLNALTVSGGTGLVTVTSGLAFSGTAAALTGTGTPTCASTGTGCTNGAGDVTAGATATSVVITFAGGGFGTGVPTCSVVSHTQLVAFAYVVSATAITVTQTATTGNIISYICHPH